MRGNHTQCGFSLVTAIFLLVVLAGLGAAMVTFSTAQNQGQTMDVLGSRAYQAAQAGIEWAAYKIETTPGLPGGTTFTPGTGTALGGNLSNFTVTVAYDAASAPASTEEGTDVIAGVVWSYNITASAAYGTPGTPSYVQRIVTAKR